MKRQAYQLRSTQQLDRGKLFLKGFKKIQDITVVANADQFQIVATLPLNPGLVGTFGWAAGIASNYEMYDLHKCKFYYRTMTANALSASPALGTIIMATQYNSLSAPFPDKKTMENAYGASSGIISTDRVHYVQVNGGVLENQFIRTEADPSGADKRMTDVGVTYIATSGLPSPAQGLAVGTVIGELWCSYKMTLMKEVQNTSDYVARAFSFSNNQCTTVGDEFCGPLLTGAIAPGSMATIRRDIFKGNRWIIKNPGKYMFVFSWATAGTASTAVAYPDVNPVIAGSMTSFSNTALGPPNIGAGSVAKSWVYTQFWETNYYDAAFDLGNAGDGLPGAGTNNAFSMIVINWPQNVII